jgi:hypothetical protein
MRTRHQTPASTLAVRSPSSSALKTSATVEVGTKKGRFYKPLPKQFRRDGFDYRQIAREGDVAIYSQTWSGCPDAVASFEVIRVKLRPSFEINGRFVSAGEVYPASKLWGTDGFTLTDKESAFAKLRELA